jgi:hypothetical protein
MAYGWRRIHGLPVATAALFLVVFLTIVWAAPGIDRQVEKGPDHCYQLSLGRQILLGKRPFEDLFFHYGPLVAYTSAFGLVIHNSLVPETIFCALGYAAAIGLSFAVARRLAGPISGLMLVAAQFLLMGRFYKWYYWLFPVLTMFLLMRLSRQRQPRLSAVLLGLGAGLAFLFRMDLGVGCLVLAGAGIVLVMFGRQSLSAMLLGEARVLAGFVAPVVIWLTFLTVQSGPAAATDYFSSYVASATGVVHGMALPVPKLTWDCLRRPLSLDTASGLAFRVLPAIALLGLITALWLIVRRRADSEIRLVGIACLGALVFFPQALHRSGPYHLLQALALFALAVTVALSRLWTAAPVQPLAVRTGRRLLTVFAGALLGLIILGLRPLWSMDLEFAAASPLTKYRRLAVGLDAARPSDTGRAAMFVRDHTTADDTVLPLSFFNNLLFFSQRKAAGLLPCYVPGLLSQDSWQERNLRQIIADRPKYVLLAAGGPIDDKPENELSCFLAKIWVYVQAEYPVVAYQNGNFVVRARQSP